jgi:deoxyribodipyrimidine photo-lyase
MGVQVVWFKRDLRVHDHGALSRAAETGPTLGLYVFEPELLAAPDADGSHVEFVRQGLVELRRALRRRGGRLLVRVGDPVEILAGLRDSVPFEALWSHQETGSLLSYARDRRVATWCREQGVTWHQPWQNGVVRGLRTRDGWSRVWNQRMSAAEVPAPAKVPAPVCPLEDGHIPSIADLALPPSSRGQVQRGGESAARETLESFLAARSVDYRSAMSSPVEGWEGCSRLSAYLAWGNISVRTVHRAARARSEELKALRAGGEDVASTWLPSLASFQSRLRWHCHFIQKLEDQPDLEEREMNAAFRGLRDDGWNEQRFDAWLEGRTGYPMVDACMRCLAHTGWVNFRMRAMLVSFACHHLWLPWQPVARALAPRFLDYEPGIHYSQAQMQAGVTGINTVRIYSPAKQVRDQDPRGVFIRRWVPELDGVPDRLLPEPERMSADEQRSAGCRIGRDYPAPIVDHAEAYAAARARIAAVRRTDAARDEAKRVYDKHGSRKRQPRRGRRARPADREDR